VYEVRWIQRKQCHSRFFPKLASVERFVKYLAQLANVDTMSVSDGHEFEVHQRHGAGPFRFAFAGICGSSKVRHVAACNGAFLPDRPACIAAQE